MKNILIKALVVIAIVVALVLTFYIFSNAKENEQNKSQKIEKEIDYLDGKITNLINELNRNKT